MEPAGWHVDTAACRCCRDGRGGILFAFVRIGTEPEWKTALQAVGFSLAVTAAILIVLGLAVRSRH